MAARVRDSFEGLDSTESDFERRKRKHQGQEAGEFLLIDALRRSFAQPAQIASTALIVEAANDRAVLFYRRFGFIAFPAAANRLFLPMKTVARLFQ